MAEEAERKQESVEMWNFTARSARTAVTDPLVCGDCSAVICRRCGTPLERIDELGIG